MLGNYVNIGTYMSPKCNIFPITSLNFSRYGERAYLNSEFQFVGYNPR